MNARGWRFVRLVLGVAVVVVYGVVLVGARSAS